MKLSGLFVQLVFAVDDAEDRTLVRAGLKANKVAGVETLSRSSC